jgi:hypothetical protein
MNLPHSVSAVSGLSNGNSETHQKLTGSPQLTINGFRIGHWCSASSKVPVVAQLSSVAFMARLRNV